MNVAFRRLSNFGVRGSDFLPTSSMVRGSKGGGKKLSEDQREGKKTVRGSKGGGKTLSEDQRKRSEDQRKWSEDQREGKKLCVVLKFPSTAGEGGGGSVKFTVWLHVSLSIVSIPRAVRIYGGQFLAILGVLIDTSSLLTGKESEKYPLFVQKRHSIMVSQVLTYHITFYQYEAFGRSRKTHARPV